MEGLKMCKLCSHRSLRVCLFLNFPLHVTYIFQSSPSRPPTHWRMCRPKWGWRTCLVIVRTWVALQRDENCPSQRWGQDMLLHSYWTSSHMFMSLCLHCSAGGAPGCPGRRWGRSHGWGRRRGPLHISVHLPCFEVQPSVHGHDHWTQHRRKKSSSSARLSTQTTDGRNSVILQKHSCCITHQILQSVRWSINISIDVNLSLDMTQLYTKLFFTSS